MFKFKVEQQQSDNKQKKTIESQCESLTWTFNIKIILVIIHEEWTFFSSSFPFLPFDRSNTWNLLIITC